MKITNNAFFAFIAVIGIFIISSCSDDEKLDSKSVLDLSTPELTELDHWIRDNYTFPYNIEVLYNWNQNEVDQNRYLFPPLTDSVQPALEYVKKIWIDTFTDVGGEDFIKEIAPRQLLLVGGVNRNPDGTVTLGIAEGGKKITLFETDLTDFSDTEADKSIRFVGTIFHEYTHILNQTIPFDEETYGKITPSNYTAQWFNNSIEESRELGYITDYARAEVIEDFAEMVKVMLSNSNDEWNAIIDGITSEEGKAAIRTKEAMVEEYFQDAFNINIYDLQDVAEIHRSEI